MGFDCVICSKLLEEEPDPSAELTNTNTSQVQIPAKKSRTAIVFAGPSTCRPAKQQQPNANENLVVTHCGHLFHKICISQWINKAGSCPQCRELCSIAQLNTIYPDINTDKELQLQESMEKCQSLESLLSKSKCIEVETRTKMLQLESELIESRKANSALITSISLINNKCIEQETELQNLRKEIEKLQTQANSDPLSMLQHFKSGECKFEAQVQEILNKLNKNAQQQQVGGLQDQKLSLQTPKPSTSKCSTSSSSLSSSSSTNPNPTNKSSINRLKLSQLVPVSISPTLLRLSPPPPPTPPLLGFNGEYELKSSKNFKHYLEALGIEICTDNLTTHCHTPKYWKSSPMAPHPTHWERELATISLIYPRNTADVMRGGCITTDYYYNQCINRTSCKFTPGEEFVTSLEGTGKCNDEHDNLTSIKTMITMESPAKMKQVQTYKTKHHNRAQTVTVWREFSPTKMKVTLQHPRMPHACVRVYEKIIPGKHEPKKQERCREISADY